MTPRRILFINYEYPPVGGGGGNAMRHIAREMARRGHAPFDHKAAALVLASLIATPYMMDYDMMAASVAIAFCVHYGLSMGFKPYEKTLLVVLFIAPLVARMLALHAFIPFGVLALLALFVRVVKLAKQ